MPLKQLIYTSVAVGDLTKTALQVLERAAVFNLSRRITGVLVLDHRCFAQILEGRSSDVDDLMNRIRRDPRHSDVRIVLEEHSSVRHWPNWQMSLIAPIPSHQAIFMNYGIDAHQGRGKSLADLAPTQLKTLLHQFSEHNLAQPDNAKFRPTEH